MFIRQTGPLFGKVSQISIDLTDVPAQKRKKLGEDLISDIFSVWLQKEKKALRRGGNSPRLVRIVQQPGATAGVKVDISPDAEPIHATVLDRDENHPHILKGAVVTYDNTTRRYMTNLTRTAYRRLGDLKNFYRIPKSIRVPFVISPMKLTDFNRPIQSLQDFEDAIKALG